MDRQQLNDYVKDYDFLMNRKKLNDYVKDYDFHMNKKKLNDYMKDYVKASATSARAHTHPSERQLELANEEQKRAKVLVHTYLQQQHSCTVR